MLGKRLANAAPQRAGPAAVDDGDAVEAGEQRGIKVFGEPLERRLEPLAAEIELRRDARRSAWAQLLGLEVTRRGAADRLGDDLDVIGGNDQASPFGLERDPSGA